MFCVVFAGFTEAENPLQLGGLPKWPQKSHRHFQGFHVWSKLFPKCPDPYNVNQDSIFENESELRIRDLSTVE